jgi:hypothetical protein
MEISLRAAGDHFRGEMSAIHFLTLHRDSDRHAFFEREQPPLTFDPATESWICADPQIADRILRSEHTRSGTSDLPDSYKQIAEKLGTDFPTIRLVCAYLPLCWEGEEQKRIRRPLADFLGAGRQRTGPRLEAMVSESLSVLAGRRELDLMIDFVNPLVSKYMSVATGLVASRPDLGNGLTSVFDRLIGMSKRRQLEEDMSVAKRDIEAALGETGSRDEVGLRLAAFIFGQDTLRGTLGESIYQTIRRSEGQRFCDMAFGDYPHETSVPLVDRVVVTPFDLDGTHLDRGSRIRILMQKFAYSSDEADKRRTFGVGAHACLGRQLSLDLWRELRRQLGMQRGQPTVLSYRAGLSDYTFLVPDSVRLEIHP